ncbi:MAG TPA: PaaI family thioesterase [Acidimicrobiales bacterium]|nr:PaaI family thioesterase [Acidimicrobiales bacterium]
MSDDVFDFVTSRPSVHDHLGVEVIEVSDERVVLTLEVGPRSHQPFGLLHGGISALLAESAASIGATRSVWPDRVAVGTELNCSHLRSMSEGTLTATARPLRKGRRVHVWTIDLTDDEGNLICAARCSLQIVAAPSST